MRSIFGDTSGWAQLIDPDEMFHDFARAIYESTLAAKRRIVTTNYIIAELVSLLTSRSRLHRNGIIRFITDLTSSPHFEVIHVDRALHRKAWELLSARTDKLWSLVDCSSFVVMKERGISDALTTDRHFEQAGFNILLK